MELFEQIRREYEHGTGTIQGVAKKLGIHRRMAREALANALPRERKIAVRARPKLAPAAEGLCPALAGVKLGEYGLCLYRIYRVVAHRPRGQQCSHEISQQPSRRGGEEHPLEIFPTSHVPERASPTMRMPVASINVPDFCYSVLRVLGN